MTSTIQILVLLLVIIAAAGVTAKRLQVPPAILLVVIGVGLTAIPRVPAVTLAPEIVLLLVLPLLVYSTAVAMSWREFRFNLRPISLLAVGGVVFTTAAAAAVAHGLLGMSWAVAFVLGAIVSPPDAVAPLAITRRLRVPRRLIVVLEGEGLANDATALTLYRFAVVAVSAGVFSFEKAAGMFAAMIVGELLWGIVVGWLMLRLRRWVADPQVEILLSILTPFVAYWPPLQLGGSGVLATVAAGLYVSWNGARLISSATRLQGIFFWEVLVYLIEGMLFLITGLQARSLLAGMTSYPVAALVISATVVSAVVILARFAWVFPAVYLPRLLFPPIARADPAPPWQWAFLLAFTGVRGIDSLAAALAIPLATAAGSAFPNRDLILFLTFSVICVTLVGQGLVLPAVIRALGLANAGAQEHRTERDAELQARRQAIDAGIRRLEELARERRLPKTLLNQLRTEYEGRLEHLDRPAQGDRTASRPGPHVLHEVRNLLLAAERDTINELHRLGTLTDIGRRRIERELDLLDASLANHEHEESSTGDCRPPAVDS